MGSSLASAQNSRTSTSGSDMSINSTSLAWNSVIPETVTITRRNLRQRSTPMTLAP
ncbi:hypothetical protein D3C85_1006970 [compost metagenome]